MSSIIKQNGIPVVWKDNCGEDAGEKRDSTTERRSVMEPNS